MHKRRRILVVIAVLYAIGLAWGYVRLPFAAVKSLGDYRLIANAPAVGIGQVKAAPLQVAYLTRSLSTSRTTAAPHVSATVIWNALAVARVRSAIYLGPTGAESRDVLYVCLFGVWVPVYTFSLVQA